MDEDWFALGEEGLTFDGASICAMLQLSIRAADLPVTYTALLALMGRPLQTLILIKTANSGILPTFASSRHDLNFSCLQEKNPYAEPFMAPLGLRQSTKNIFSLASLCTAVARVWNLVASLQGRGRPMSLPSSTVLHNQGPAIGALLYWGPAIGAQLS